MGLQDFECKFPRPIQFRLGLSSIRATAEHLDPMFPWVFKATLVEGRLHQLVRAWLPALPSLLSRAFCFLWPRYALPPVVVLKKPRDQTVDCAVAGITSRKQDYDNEKAMYQRLRDLQGEVIPEYFGEAWCEGRRALVISLLPGVQVNRQTAPRLTVAEYEERIVVPIRKLQKHGMIHDDDRLPNLMLVDDRIMYIDLEQVQEMDPERLEWYCSEVAVTGNVKQYSVYLEDADNSWWERTE